MREQITTFKERLAETDRFERVGVEGSRFGLSICTACLP